MSEIQNSFLSAVDINSEKQENITENEWNKISKDKDKLLSRIPNPQLKVTFESKYQSLDEYFKQEGEQVHNTTKDELSFLKEAFKGKTKTNETIKSELILKYSTEYKLLQSDIIDFLTSSFSNLLQDELGDFNISEFDKKDGKEGFSEYELEQYTIILDKAMSNMNILGGYVQYKYKCRETQEEPSFLSWKGDIALANTIDFQEHIFGEGKKHLTDKIHDYSEEELTKMRDEKFDITNSDNMKNLLVLIGLELGDGIEDILKFIGNVPSGLILLPRYINNRLKLTDSVVDTKEEVEAQMENDMLLEGNPLLVLGELLGEKGIQMIKQLGEMFVSGKNGDIALLLVTIAGLIAGGAGAVKFLAKAGKMGKIEKIAGKIQNKANKVDDIVGGAGIGHMTGAFSGAGTGNKIIDSSGFEPATLSVKRTTKQLEKQSKEMQRLLNDKSYVGDKTALYSDILDIHKEIKLTFPHSHLAGKSIAEMKGELRKIDSDSRKGRIKEIRDVVIYSQNIGLEVIRLIEKSLDEVLLKNISRNDFIKTESYKKALAITETLPIEYKNKVLEKIENFTNDTKLRSELENLSSKEIVEKIFGYTPKQGVDVKIGSVSTEINIGDIYDFKSIYTKGDNYVNLELVNGVGGFAKRGINGHIAISKNPNDLSIIEHEVQHSRFKAIVPEKKQHPSRGIKTWRDINKLLYSENLDKVIIGILQPELEKALDWVRDEALAFTKNHHEDVLSVFEKGDDAPYDYTFKIREHIKSVLLDRPDLSLFVDNIEDLNGAIDNLFMEDYLRVSKNIINTARMNSSNLDLLTIIPYNQWWRHPELIGVGDKLDYTLNLARL